MADRDEKRRLRVCVIGAGAAGLCAVRHLAKYPEKFEPAVFEQSNDVGGTWVYVDKTGLDDNGYPIHSSMYENLRTNLPVKIMNFPDYRRLGQTSNKSCGTRQDILNYLRDYTAHFQLRRYIQFDTRVTCVRPVVIEGNWKKTIWKVHIENVKSKITEEREFDGVMVCNGHFFEPNIPMIPGIETFPGSVMHSHDYRNATKYAGKRVLVLGAASSGIDIGQELASQATHVYISHNRDRLIGPLPNNMTQIAGVERINDHEFVLRDGSKVVADSFIYCTGYKYSFPFLDDSCSITVDENYVSPLYKQLINVRHPSMSIIGIPSTVIPFALFHIQVQYYLKVLEGSVALPTEAEMLENSKFKSTTKRHGHVLAERQFDYNNELAISGGFEKLPLYYKTGYLTWNATRSANLWRYKDSRFLISADEDNVEIILENRDNAQPLD